MTRYRRKRRSSRRSYRGRRRSGRRSTRRSRRGLRFSRPTMGQRNNSYSRVIRLELAPLTQTSTDVFGAYNFSIKDIVVNDSGTYNGLSAIFNRVRLNRVRVEFIPNFQMIVSNPNATASNVATPHFGEFLTAMPMFTDYTINSKINMEEAPRLKRSLVSQRHIRTFVPMAQKIDSYLNNGGGSQANGQIVRYPDCILNYDDGILMDTFPTSTNLHYYIDAPRGGGAPNGEFQSWRVYVTYWTTWSERV